MDQAAKEQVAEGVLALELVTQFLLNQVAYGRIKADDALGLVDLAQRRAIDVHHAMGSEIRDASTSIRGQIEAIMRHE